MRSVQEKVVRTRGKVRRHHQQKKWQVKGLGNSGGTVTAMAISHLPPILFWTNISFFAYNYSERYAGVPAGTTAAKNAERKQKMPYYCIAAPR